MNNIIFSLRLLLVLACFVTSCGKKDQTKITTDTSQQTILVEDTKPTHELVEKILPIYIKDKSEGRLSYVNSVKTDGKTNSQTSYTMFVTLNFLATHNCIMNMNLLFATSDWQPSEFSSPVMGYLGIKRGEHIEAQLAIDLEKRESGWVVTNLEALNFKSLPTSSSPQNLEEIWSEYDAETGITRWGIGDMKLLEMPYYFEKGDGAFSPMKNAIHFGRAKINTKRASIVAFYLGEDGEPYSADYEQLPESVIKLISERKELQSRPEIDGCWIEPVEWIDDSNLLVTAYARSNGDNGYEIRDFRCVWNVMTGECKNLPSLRSNEELIIFNDGASSGKEEAEPIVTDSEKGGEIQAGISYTPAPGSIERKAIIDVMRRDMYDDKESAIKNERNILFMIHHLAVKDGWACVHGTPTQNEREIAEPRWLVLRKSDNGWEDIDYFGKLIPFSSEEAARDALDMDKATVEKLLSLLPGCPGEIFPPTGDFHKQ